MPARVVEPLRPDIHDPLGLGDNPAVLAPQSASRGDLVDDVAALGRRLPASTTPGGVELILHIDERNARMAQDFDLPALDCYLAIYSHIQPTKLTLKHEPFDKSAPALTELGQPFWYLCFRGISPPFSRKFRGSWIDRELLAELGPFVIGELAHF